MIKVYILVKNEILGAKYDFSEKFGGIWLIAEDGNRYLASTVQRFSTKEKARIHMKQVLKVETLNKYWSR